MGPSLSVQELRNRIAGYRQQVSAQQARVEQAETFVKQAENAISEKFGVSPEQLRTNMAAMEQDIQLLGNQLDGLLRSVGA